MQSKELRQKEATAGLPAIHMLTTAGNLQT